MRCIKIELQNEPDNQLALTVEHDGIGFGVRILTARALRCIASRYAEEQTASTARFNRSQGAGLMSTSAPSQSRRMASGSPITGVEYDADPSPPE